LKNNFSQYKPFFAFLTKFLVFYVVFAFVYKMYLNQYDAKNFEVDYLTEAVAKQTLFVMDLFTENADLQPHKSDSSIIIIYNNTLVARVIEGCNAISVMILFAAFVFAFSKQWKKTVLYIIFGIVIIHVLNVVRIAALTFAMFHYPKYEEILHGTVFPLFIYGVVFILWILWVTKFSGYAKRNS
jgi:exosortase family protein XrtF